jgi:hypothetical protein
MEDAKASLQRAQQLFCKANVALQLFAAKFHERTGSSILRLPSLLAETSLGSRV